jgi:hypothetical protein
VKTPLSQIIASAIFVLLLSFLVTATRLMELKAVSRLLETLLLFLPNMLATLSFYAGRYCFPVRRQQHDAFTAMLPAQRVLVPPLESVLGFE